ncbi:MULTISPECIES: hypothetical protein [unclassified Myroides]|uniref:hypothetical protein n=1 Tax=unclassified Myroides TaxID=2642485 RepID=UPI003D2F9119
MKKLFNLLLVLFIALLTVSCDSESSGGSDDMEGGGSGSGTADQLYTTWTMYKKHQIAYEDGQVIYDQTTPYADGEITYRFDRNGTYYAQEPGNSITASFTFDKARMIIFFPGDEHGNQIKTLNDTNLTFWGYYETAGIRAETTMYFKKYTGGTGSGGGNNGGGSSDGQISFWIGSDYQCGPITVTVNGQSRSITSYYSNGIADCNATGNANFTLAPGTYSFTATCQSYNWSGTFEIKAAGCLRMNLTL